MMKGRTQAYSAPSHSFPLSHGPLTLPGSSLAHQFLFVDKEILNGLTEKDELYSSSEILTAEGKFWTFFFLSPNLPIPCFTKDLENGKILTSFGSENSRRIRQLH